MSRRVEDRFRCGLRRAAVEGRFRRVLHIKLYSLSDLVAAKLGCNVKRAVDSRGDASGKYHITVHHHSLVDRHSAEERQEVMRRPMGGRLSTLDETGRTANER